MKVDTSTLQLSLVDILVFFLLLVFPSNLDPIPFGFGVTFLFFWENGIVDDFLKHPDHEKVVKKQNEQKRKKY